MKINYFIRNSIITIIVVSLISSPIYACTGITLLSKDGGVVVARTVEWALNYAQHNQLLVVPRNK
jgi:choloylglycine hydrolase